MEPLDLPGRGRTASQEVLQDAAVVSSPGLGRPHDAGATHDPHHTTTVSSSSPRPVSPMATGTPKRKKGKAEACTRGTKRVSSRAQPARKRFMPSKYDSSLPVNSDGSPLASTEPSPRPPSACLSSGGHSPSRIQLEQVKHTLHDVQSTTGSSYAKQRSPSLRPSRPPNSSSTANNPFVCSAIEIPTVVGLLRNILTQYPDNGQIIKELVQNAEDAGATEVEVVHDTRRVQCPGAHAHLHTFLTGPALCLYNNATFTDDDWRGIQKFSDSVKKNDPLKVGQFGLGFKSVFHITDCVTIISGEKVLFMSPREQEDVMCRWVYLKDLPNKCPEEECVHLWLSYLSTQHISDGHFPATLFWFPLRQNPSEISDTLYSYDHVVRLFESFGVEASICLTFLKSLEKISLNRFTENNNIPEVMHEIKLISPSMSYIREKRRNFREKLKECHGLPEQTTTCDYEVTVRSVKGKNTQEETMRILHFLPGSNEHFSVSWRGKDKSSHMPLVGVSAPVTTQESSWSRGHIFCFLPLPLETENNTNLPIQVNGFFALDQNRRHVKWETQESSNEPDVLWNEELVCKVVVEAYFTLLGKVVEELGSPPRPSHLTTWYSLLPDIESSTGRWRKLATHLWSRLKSLPILFSEVSEDLLNFNIVTMYINV
nr:sacsin-like [Procambarus clarkii]